MPFVAGETVLIRGGATKKQGRFARNPKGGGDYPLMRCAPLIQKRDSQLFSPFTVSEKGKKVDCPFFEFKFENLSGFGSPA